MSENKKGYHVTITDNKTGEVLHDGDAIAVIAGIGTEEGARSIGFTDCNLLNLAVACQAAESACEALYEDDPVLRVFVAKHKELTEQEETNNEE